MIPKQLKKEQVRFILIKPREKIPIEKDWQKENNYKYNNPKLLNHLRRGGNYGCATGYGRICVIDFDNKDIQDKVCPSLPKTFTTQSGSGLLHKWFFTDNAESIKILDKDKNTLCDIQGKGKQIIVPPSVHPNGKKYKVIDSSEIAFLSMGEIKALFRDYLPKKEEGESKKEKGADIKQIKKSLSVPDLLSEYGVDTSKNPTACPFHGSRGGKCLSFKDDVWHCFHCDKGGDVFSLVMEREQVPFYKAKKILAGKTGVKICPPPQTTGVLIDNFLKNVEIFYDKIPFFYDNAGLFWFWEDYKYQQKDEVDVMRILDRELGFKGMTVNPKLKSQYLETFRRVGRDHIPKEAPPKWIQFRDEVFDIDKKELFEATPEYFFTNPIPFEIGIDDKTPVLDKLFKEWVGEKYVKTLYEVIAYCCYRDYPIQLIICIVGHGRNGKGCFQKVLSKFIGMDNICSTSMGLISGYSMSRFESFKLYKKLIAMMGETNFGLLSNTDLIKRLVGGDVIGFEKKGKDPFDDYNYAKVIIASNSLPTTQDQSDGFYRRWLIIDFSNQFPEGKDITKQIPILEYSALAKKVINLLPELLERGKFTNQGEIEERKKKYIECSNPLPLFIKARCELDDCYFSSYNNLYSNYIDYLKKNKKRKVSRKEFKSALEDEGLYVEKGSKKVGGEFVSGFWIDGIKLILDF